MKKRVLFILSVIISTITLAQSHEAGVLLGGSNFIGDVGRTNYIYPNKFSGGIMYKYNINPRIALRGNYTYIALQGNDSNSDNSFRKLQNRSFSNNIHEFAAGAEFNFYDYNISDYRTTYTPYIFAQLAAFSHGTASKRTIDDEILFQNKFSYAIPFGIGVKGLLFDSLAIAFEIGARYTFTDEIDYSTPKINNLDFGGNGNDLYTFTGISIVYTFGRPQCYSGLTN